MSICVFTGPSRWYVVFHDCSWGVDPYLPLDDEELSIGPLNLASLGEIVVDLEYAIPLTKEIKHFGRLPDLQEGRLIPEKEKKGIQQCVGSVVSVPSLSTTLMRM